MRIAVTLIFTLLAIAAFADFLASDLPIALRRHGELTLLPNLTHPAALRALDNQNLTETLASDDWAIMPLVPWGPNTFDLDAVLAAPSGRHWFGTDSSGRDVFARVVHGTRVSLSVGMLSAVLVSLVGLGVGLCAGYYGGTIDALLMRIADTLHAVPTLLLAITLLSVLRPSGYSAIFALLLVIGGLRWPDSARLVRAHALRARASAYVTAAHALGLTPTRIMLRHILPNVLSPVLVAASFSMAGAIILEGALSFLGFGMPADVASWGSLLRDAREHIQAWWLALFPGVSLFITVVTYNRLGEALRDSIDPTLEM